jgi:SAM-dependent methyltransferase
MIKCEDGDEVMDGMIVEFRWSTADSCWIPLRVRHDKTEKFYKTKDIAGTANKFETALSVWSSIVHPVTLGVLTMVPASGASGQSTKTSNSGSTSTGEGGVYYARSLSRAESHSAGLRAFHNRWVKGHHLLHRFKGHAKSLVDFGCGRAGDLPKWLHMSLEKVLGLDLYADNIQNPRDGAHERALGHLRGKPACRGRPMMAFLPFDMSVLMSPESLSSLANEDDRAAAEIMWALRPAATGIRDPCLRAYHGFARQGFDVVSCQFAVHYFFASEQTLMNFAANVSNFLKPGGYFVGTCLDAGKVNDAVKGLPLGGAVEGLHEGVTIWQIVRLYESFDEKDPSKNIGLKIRVYMETIGQSLVEYLVDFRVLVSAMAKVGLHPLTTPECKQLSLDNNNRGSNNGGPVNKATYSTGMHPTYSTGTFGELHSDLREQHRSGKRFDDVDPGSVQLALNMSDAESQYSFMNRWFIFRKSADS